MMLTWFNRLMASLLTTLLFVCFVIFAASQTFLSAPYMKAELQKQNAYSKLSAAISKDISDNADASLPQDQVTQQLQTILTPTILKQRLNNTIDQIQAYYKGGNTVPTLDVSDLVNKAEDAGLPVPNDPKLQQPIKLTAAEKAKKVSNIAKAAGAALVALIVLLIIGLTIVARKRHNYRPLAAVVVSLGVMLSVTGGALLVVPHIFNHLYTFNAATNPFGTLAHDVALGVLHDFALRLFIPGLALFVIGVGTRLLMARATKHATVPAAESPASPATNTPVTSLPTTTSPTDSIETPTTVPPVPRRKPPRKIQL